MKINRIKESCLYSRNLQSSREFYEGKLGLKCFTFLPGKMAFYRVGESVLLVFDPTFSKENKQLPGHWATGPYHLAFEVDQQDYQAWKTKVVAAGIEVTYEHTWSETQLSFYFNDPDGNVLEIVMTGLWDDV